MELINTIFRKSVSFITLQSCFERTVGFSLFRFICNIINEKDFLKMLLFLVNCVKKHILLLFSRICCALLQIKSVGHHHLHGYRHQILLHHCSQNHLHSDPTATFFRRCSSFLLRMYVSPFSSTDAMSRIH